MVFRDDVSYLNPHPRWLPLKKKKKTQPVKKHKIKNQNPSFSLFLRTFLKKHILRLSECKIIKNIQLLLMEIIILPHIQLYRPKIILSFFIERFLLFLFLFPFYFLDWGRRINGFMVANGEDLVVSFSVYTHYPVRFVVANLRWEFLTSLMKLDFPSSKSLRRYQLVQDPIPKEFTGF